MDSDLNDTQKREQILDEFNRENLDDVGPLGGDQSMAVLNEMNELEDGLDEFVKSLGPRVHVL